MAWVWGHPREVIEFGADIDYDMSTHLKGTEHFSTVAVDESLRPVFRSRNSLKRFTRMHNPPVGISPVVDNLWKEIILSFVGADRVQFLPIRLIARGEICDDFSWVIPFDRVRCIDVKNSEIGSKIERPDITLIFSIGKTVHVTNCLRGLHLARDEQMTDHILISVDLKEALSATGEDSAFRWCEESHLGQ